jgi:hypothetical protein
MSWKKDKKAFDSRDFILLNEYKIISIGAFFPGYGENSASTGKWATGKWGVPIWKGSQLEERD